MNRKEPTKRFVMISSQQKPLRVKNRKLSGRFDSSPSLCNFIFAAGELAP